MSDRVVSDIQTRAEGEWLYNWYNTDANWVYIYYTMADKRHSHTKSQFTPTKTKFTPQFNRWLIAGSSGSITPTKSQFTPTIILNSRHNETTDWSPALQVQSRLQNPNSHQQKYSIHATMKLMTDRKIMILLHQNVHVYRLYWRLKAF